MTFGCRNLLHHCVLLVSGYERTAYEFDRHRECRGYVCLDLLQLGPEGTK